MHTRATRRAAAGVLLSCLFAVTSAHAADDLYRLQREWWQWAGSIFVDYNPVVEQTGAYCEAGQRGPYWFLDSGTGGEITKSCTVPKGVKLFVPVVTTFCYPEEGFDTDASCIEYVTGALQGYRRVDLIVRLDGARQPTFDVCEIAAGHNDVLTGIPSACLVRRRGDRTLWDFVIDQSGFYLSPPGVWRANAARGIWALINTRDLEVGEHLVRIQATGDDTSIIPFIDARWNLTISEPQN
jgi:hypothetical protein